MYLEPDVVVKLKTLSLLTVKSRLIRGKTLENQVL